MKKAYYDGHKLSMAKGFLIGLPVGWFFPLLFGPVSSPFSLLVSAVMFGCMTAHGVSACREYRNYVRAGRPTVDDLIKSNRSE